MCYIHQVRAGVVRWRITHVGEQPPLRQGAAAFVAALSCCWCFGSRQRPNSDIRILNDVESGGQEGGPPTETAPRIDGQVLPNQIPGSTARLSPSGATTSLQVILSLSGQPITSSRRFDQPAVSGIKLIRSGELRGACALDVNAECDVYFTWSLLTNLFKTDI